MKQTIFVYYGVTKWLKGLAWASFAANLTLRYPNHKTNLSFSVAPKFV